MKHIMKILLMTLFSISSTAGFCAEIGVMRGMTAEHNAVREKVGSPEMYWSEDLAGYAQLWAEYLAEERGCALQHRPRTGKYRQKFGENLYWASAIRVSDGTRKQQRITADKVVQSWVSEVEYYSYTTNSCRSGEVCGHYTQVIWKQTERVGCGRAVCANKSQIWVCNYDPPGNVIGQKPY